MSLTVSTPTQTRLLTTVARVKTEIGISASTDDDFLDSCVRHATDMVEKYCNRIFHRQTYSENSPSFGGPHFLLRQAPVAGTLGTVSYDGDTITDVELIDKAKGLLYREAGFGWTAQSYAGLEYREFWMENGRPISGSEEHLWTFAYTAGFIVPPQDRLSVATISADATTDSFSDSASLFPALLKSGDIIETSGFSNSANNGRFLVTGTPTVSNIVVDGALTTETAAAGRTLRVANLPGDVERGAIEIVKSLYAKRSVDGSISSRSAGPLSISYFSQMAAAAGMPLTAAALLKPWIRRV